MASRKGFVALGTLPDFREGWAIIPFVEKPHYWRDCGPIVSGGGRLYKSSCGLRHGLPVKQKPVVPGNFPKCKRCERSMTETAE